MNVMAKQADNLNVQLKASWLIRVTSPLVTVTYRVSRKNMGKMEGLGMPDFTIYILALKLAWVRREITSTHICTKLFAVMTNKGEFLSGKDEKSQTAQTTASVF